MNTQNNKYILFSMAALMTANGAVLAQEEAETKDLVNMPFRQVESQDLIQAASVVDVKALMEKEYITYSLDGMQALVGGYNGQLWNQGEALVVVDGVPREATNVLPSEIDQITFLKGANAVVLYGSRAAKGAILITTKRGHSEGLKVNVRGNYSLYTPKAYPEYLGSAEYMTLYNEARANDGLGAQYSQEQIYHTAAGTNPARYPDINFFDDEYIKKSYGRWDATAEFEGGGRFAHFYTNIGYYRVGDLVDFGEGKDNYTDRLNIRGNIDLRLNDWVTGWVNANATYYNARNDRSNFWAQSATLRPNRVNPLLPISLIEQNDENGQILAKNAGYIIDGKYILGGTQLDPTNPFASMYVAGYSTWTSRQMNFDAGINLDLDKVIKGLSFRAQFSIDYANSYQTSIENNYATYIPTWTNYAGNDLVSTLTKEGKDERTGTQQMSNSATSQTMMMSAQFDYKRQWNDVHNFHATALAHGYQISAGGEYHRTSNVNLGFQASYNYDHRYYADLGMAVVHSVKVSEGLRNAASPALTLGWRITGEDWMKDQTVFDDLRLTASASILNQDLDIDGYYLYSDNFVIGNYYRWADNRQKQASESKQIGNGDLDYIQRKEITVGLNGSMLDKRLNFAFNFFQTKTEGLVSQPTNSVPSYFVTYWPENSFLSYVNYGENKRQGFDFNVNYKQKIGEVELAAGISGMLYDSENTKVNELNQWSYLNQKGQAIDALWGLECLGFFNTEEEVKNWATSSFGTCKPGDLKYKDQNGDGIIDDKDQVVLGRWSAKFTGGLDITAKYKGFTLYALFTGQFGGQAVKNDSYNWVYGDGKYSDVVRGRWTKATAASATYPRLSSQNDAGNNFRTSSFWVYDTNRVDLGRVQLSYDLPSSLFDQKIVKGVQVYFSGNSLCTLSKEREQMERNVGSAPQTRSYNVGLNVKF